MAEAYARFAQWGRGALGGAQAVREAHTIWDLGEAEGYVSERGRLAADAAWVAAAHSE
jgi:hypothetical protein